MVKYSLFDFFLKVENVVDFNKFLCISDKENRNINIVLLYDFDSRKYLEISEVIVYSNSLRLIMAKTSQPLSLITITAAHSFQHLIFFKRSYDLKNILSKKIKQNGKSSRS